MHSKTSIWQELAGPCSGRSESRTCGEPEPIEFINGVGPDCDGILTLALSGCVQAAAIETDRGVTISCDLGLADVCRPSRLPTSDGILPGEVDPEPGVSEDDDGAVSEVSESLPGAVGLPFEECFAALPADFTVKVGTWEADSDDAPGASPCGDAAGSYAAVSTSTRNVSVWDGPDTTAVDRRVTTAVKLVSGSSGAKHNGGIVLNHREHASNAGLFIYHTVELDYEAQELRIRRFNGSNYTTLTSAIVPSLSRDRWYQLEASVQPGAGDDAAITARVQSLEDGTVDLTLGPLLTNGYGPATGGLATNRAEARFAYFTVEQAD